MYRLAGVLWIAACLVYTSSTRDNEDANAIFYKSSGIPQDNHQRDLDGYPQKPQSYLQGNPQSYTRENHQGNPQVFPQGFLQQHPQINPQSYLQGNPHQGNSHLQSFLQVIQQGNPQGYFQGNPPNYPQGNSQGNFQIYQQGKPQSFLQGNPQGYLQGNVQGNFQTYPQITPQNYPQGIPEGNSTGYPLEIPQGNPQSYQQGTPQENQQGYSQGNSQGHTQIISQGKPQDNSHGYPEEGLQGKPHEHSQVNLQGNPQNCSQGNPQGNSDGQYQGYAGNTQGYSQGRPQGNTLGIPQGNAQKQCTCMPYHKCRKDSQGTSENTTEAGHYGENIIDIRWDAKDSTGECDHYLDKCCFPADPSTTPPPPPPTPSQPSPNPTGGSCGARHPEGVGFRITGATDNEASYGEFPWMVAVIRRDKVIGDLTLKIMECGGSIIHPQVVLTGAHCVKGKKNLYVRAGEWDTQTEKEMHPTQDRDVKQVIVHEAYYAGGLHNDVALLVLASPLEMSPVVGTLCLPEQGEDMDGRNCVVSGWGKDVFGKEGKYQVILKRVELPIVPREPCQKALRETRLGSRFQLHESFLCAGGQPGKDACKGDGGSPLACPSKADPSVYVQAGMVAWGIGCGQATPAVYVNVPLFRTWIDNKMAALRLS